MQFMLVLHTAICTNVFKNTETQKPHFTDWFLWQAFFDPKGSYEEFYCLKKYTNKFHCLLYKVFFIRELRPAFNVQSDSICAKVFN